MFLAPGISWLICRIAPWNISDADDVPIYAQVSTECSCGYGLWESSNWSSAKSAEETTFTEKICSVHVQNKLFNNGLPNVKTYFLIIFLGQCHYDDTMALVLFWMMSFSIRLYLFLQLDIRVKWSLTWILRKKKHRLIYVNFHLASLLPNAPK